MNPSIAFSGLVVCLFVAASSASAQSINVDEAAVADARGALIERMVTRHGFERSEVAAILNGAVIDQDVLRRISRPAERIVPWYEYRQIFLNEPRIQAGVEFWQSERELVESVAEEHGVEPEMILAIVGIESLFGERMGRFRVLDSLSTLAFAYPPRSDFFAGELEAFLLMSQEEGPEFLDALGSYAGAMGAGQFIPTSYRAYAVDGDGDGRRDLWANWNDILGSVANYLSTHGWKRGEPVAVTATRSPESTGPEPRNRLALDETVGSLTTMGYRAGNEMDSSLEAMIVGLERSADETEYWVGLNNFYVITRYNRSVKYALAAHQLSQEIKAAYLAIPGSVL